MPYDIETAASQLSRLIEAALAGEDVLIAKDDAHIVKLVALAKAGDASGSSEERASTPASDALRPLTAEERALWEGRD